MKSNKELIARVSETECEIAFCDESGPARYALVDDEKGWAMPLTPVKGGAS